MQEAPSRVSSWKELLASPPRAAHIVQIYDRQDFLAGAVAYYAAEGLQRDESILLSGTPATLARVRRALAKSGVDEAAAVREGRLALNDVHETLARVGGGKPWDGALFAAFADEVLGRRRAHACFRGIRWWGELANTLHHWGDRKGAAAIEGFADAAAARHGVTIFCSYLCDRFEAQAYDGMLGDLCATHSHFIPAEDYVGHRLAVNRAIAEVVGEIRGSLLQSLTSWKGLQCELPSSQALLFWLRETMPEQFEAVLSRAKACQTNGVRPCI